MSLFSTVLPIIHCIVKSLEEIDADYRQFNLRLQFIKHSRVNGAFAVLIQRTHEPMNLALFIAYGFLLIQAN